LFATTFPTDRAGPRGGWKLRPKYSSLRTATGTSAKSQASHLEAGLGITLGVLEEANSQCTYRGECTGNRLGPAGTYEWPSGNCYSGEYSVDTTEGIGVFEYTDGGWFAGAHKANRPVHGIVRNRAGHRTFERWGDDGSSCPSVPFDDSNPEHAAVFRAAQLAKASLFAPSSGRLAHSNMRQMHTAL
jgi:hypothetical protein